jgi:hypothetical protein
MDGRYFRARSLAQGLAAMRRRMTGLVPRMSLAVLVVAIGPALAACGSATSDPTTASSSSGPAGTFHVTVNFTGAGNVQGALTTPTVGATCAQYATNSLAWTIGLGPPVGSPVLVDG